MEKYILDRFEEELAVLEKEDGSTKNVRKELLAGAKEGDVIIFCDGGYIVDADETAKRRAAIIEKAKKVFKNN